MQHNFDDDWKSPSLDSLSVFFKVNSHHAFGQMIRILQLGVCLFHHNPTIGVLFFIEHMGPEVMMFNVEMSGSLVGLLVGCQQVG